LLVTACLGHITDLITDKAFYGVLTNHAIIPIYSTIKRCRNCGYQFTHPSEKCPKCDSENIDDSKYRIEALRRIAYETGYVIIGTDPDEEGEKIAWDLKNLLEGFAEIKRAEFHEVTKHAILTALEKLRDVEEKMVESQIVRRIEDRWTGFALSEILQKTFRNRNLSAGRVQTPVLGWVVERCKEHKEKKKIGIIKELGISVEDLEKSEIEVEIKEVEERIEEKTPLPPYTTDTLLRDANTILKISAKEAIQIAQTLFENGLITYHRTDSTRVSDVGLKIAQQFLGEEFKGRTWKAEGAHECIRPTRPIDKATLQRLIYEKIIQVEEINWKHLALYDLIFKRFMSSQCKNYKVKIKKYEILVDGKRIEEERVVKAEGKAVELYKWNVFIKPELPLGKRKVKVVVRQVPKVPLYSQSDLVQLMKERKIGRPSTYATIIDRLFLRNYVKERNGKVFVTPRGLKVYYFLSKKFSKFVSEERTRILHETMEKIERGEVDYQEVLRYLFEEVKVIKPKVPYKRFFIEDRYW
jgi:reverse gyrase